MFLPKQLAKNIRQFRHAKGMTQTELAAVLHLSPQSISKWERGQAVPDIENLCAMAQALNTTADLLLGTGTQKGKAMLGIDGGGSKTEFLLFTRDGKVLERLVLGPCNPNAIGLEQCIAVLRRGIDAMLESCSDLQGVFVGASGFFTGGNGKKVCSQLRSAYPGILFRCQSDIMNVIAAGTDGENCAAAICGTGSVLFAKEGDRLSQIGGWGYLLSKGGSGYDIGRAVLCAALEDVQVLGERTLLTEFVQARLNAPVETCISEVYKHDQSFVASFAPLAFAAAERGDRVAEQILSDQAQELARVINSAVEKHNCDHKVILSGGLLTGSAVFARQVLENLRPGISALILEVPQIVGACRLCAKLCGADTPELMDTLCREYNKLIESRNKPC